MLGFVGGALRGLLSALLPAPERDRIVAGHAVSPPRWSFALGLIGGGAGLLLYIEGALAFIVPLGGEQAELLLDTAQPGLNRLAGSIAWIAWHFQPEAWLYMYLALVGLVRVVAFAVTRQAVAEPAILPLVRGVQWVAGAWSRRRRRALLGPLREDRVLEQEGGDLLVISCREKEDWNTLATIKLGGRFYNVVDTEEIDDESWRALAYRLREATPGEPVRALVKSRLKPPAGHTGALRTPPAGCIWYFAFGTTMDEATMVGAVADATHVDTARLSGYALRFARAGADGSGEAAVVSTGNPTDVVWGVVWECGEAREQDLDTLERIDDDCAWRR